MGPFYDHKNNYIQYAMFLTKQCFLNKNLFCSYNLREANSSSKLNLTIASTIKILRCHSNFRYGGNAKVVHFLGKTKPWSYTFDPKAKRITGPEHEATTHPTFLLDWWNLYSSAVVPMLHKQYGDQPFHSGCVVEVNEHFCFIELYFFAISLYGIIFIWLSCK